MKQKILLAFIYLFTAGAAAGSLFAQTMNLEQARALALTNSRSLARYNLSIQSSLLDEQSQLFSMLPTISANYSASMPYMDDKFRFVNPLDTFRAEAGFSVTQKIFEGGKSLIRKAIGEIATESVRKEAQAEYFNVLDSVDSAYYAVLEAAANLKSADSSLQTTVLNLSTAEIRQSSGMITRGEYLKAQADKESRENSRNQARRNLSVCVTNLNTLTGLAQTVELEPIDFSVYEGAVESLSKISDESADALHNAFWQILVQSNPSLAQAALSNQRAEKNLTSAKRDFAPTISATVFSAGVNYSTADGFGTTSGGGVSLTGTIPVDFWVMNNKIEQSKIARQSTALSYIDTELSLQSALQSALLSAYTQAGSVLSVRRSLEYAEKNLEYVTERYRLSQGSASELSDASALVNSSRVQLIQAECGFLEILSQLRSLGAIDDEEKLLAILTENSL